MGKSRCIKVTDFPVYKRNCEGCKFDIDMLVLHLKSGGVYRIVLLPDVGRMENNAEPAYSYQGLDGRVWHRNKVDMEDGRFVEYDDRHTVDWHIKRHLKL